MDITSENSSQKTLIDNISAEIQETEFKLTSLRRKYLSITGELPPQSVIQPNWKWTIFMTLGIAYITCIVYLIGIKKSGIHDYVGIPAFLYKADVQYFAILTFFIIFAIINVQQDQLRGYQILLIFLGFWCAHWFIYDWAWWALEIGFGHINLSTFWTKPFYSPLLIENPPMWLFLLEAILGLIVSIYTFSIPDNYKKLIPSIIWLYTVYANASLCSILGLNTPITLLIGISLIVLVFSLMIYYTHRKLQTLKPLKTKDWFHKSNWTTNPLSFPYSIIFITLFLLSYIFSIIEPIIGIIFGMIPWFVMPTVYTFVKATRSAKFSPLKQILTVILVIVGLVILTIFMAVAVERS